MLKALLDIMFPRYCCVCGRRLGVNEDVICRACLSDMPFTGFEENPYENDMAKTFWGRIHNFQKAFAIFYHNSHAASAYPVYQLKYDGKPDIGISLGMAIGKIMSRHGLLDDVDAILPVPLAPARLKQRGYNQGLMIANGVSDVTGLPVFKDVIKRETFSSSQTSKDRWGRTENVNRAFRLVNGDKIRDKHILIIDDVVTTGATICSMASQLQMAGGVRISVASVSYAGGWRDNRPEKDDK